MLHRCIVFKYTFFHVIQVSYLAGVGGGLSDIVRRMFEKLMTLELVAKYCYKGQNKTKFNFESLMLHGVMIGEIFIIKSYIYGSAFFNKNMFIISLLDAIKSQAAFENLSDDIFEKKIGTYLKNAPGKLSDANSPEAPGDAAGPSGAAARSTGQSK